MATPKPLTKRQTQILRLTCEGMNHRQIADALSISMSTVSHHTQEMMQRLRIDTACKVGPACYRLGRIDEAAQAAPP